MEYAVCPNCGMEQSSWADPAEGYVLADNQYCCRGCAEDAECICGAAQEEQLSTPGFLFMDDEAMSEDWFRLSYDAQRRERDGNRVRRFSQDCE